MILLPKYFSLDELVCEHVYERFGNIAWQFFDARLLITIDRIRDLIKRPIYVNDWQIHGKFSQRGFRCLQCELVKDACLAGKIYVSPHMTGQGVDFDVQGMTAQEAREWIYDNRHLLPYPVRLENDVEWVHLDTRDATGSAFEKVVFFNP